MFRLYIIVGVSFYFLRLFGLLGRGNGGWLWSYGSLNAHMLCPFFSSLNF